MAAPSLMMLPSGSPSRTCVSLLAVLVVAVIGVSFILDGSDLFPAFTPKSVKRAMPDGAGLISTRALFSKAAGKVPIKVSEAPRALPQTTVHSTTSPLTTVPRTTAPLTTALPTTIPPATTTSSAPTKKDSAAVSVPPGKAADLCPRPLLEVWGDSHETGKASWAWPRPAMADMRCGESPMLQLCCKPTRTVLVLMWNTKLFGLPFMPHGKESTLPFLCCNGVQISYTTDRSMLKSADIVEFHQKNYLGGDRPARSDQLWMIFNMEGQYQTPQTLGGEANLWRSYLHSSDVFNPYSDVGACQCNRTLSPLKVPFEKRDKVPFVAIVSNCASQTRREGLLRTLNNNVESHNLGNCFHNHKMPPAKGDRRQQIESMLYNYKFVFAVENAICTDYVTEKFHRTFRLGVVPVVASANGKPGYENYGPTLTSYLDVSRFKDAVAAAEEINAAAASKEKYMKYHAYRLPTPSEKISDTYNTRVCMEKDNGDDRGWCKLTEQVASPEGRKKLLARRRSDLTPSSDCLPNGYLGRIYQ